MSMLKYGPGSPGEVARVMAQSYKLVKSENPTLSDEELLAKVLERRYAVVSFASPEEQRRMLDAAISETRHSRTVPEPYNRSLFFDLIMEILKRENPGLEYRHALIEHYLDVEDAISSVLEEELETRIDGLDAPKDNQ